MPPGQIINLFDIPYLDRDNLAGRFIGSMAFWDEDGWHVYIQVEPGKVMHMAGFPAEMYYFSRSPEKPDDLYFHFLDFVSQRANRLTVMSPLAAMKDDVNNLAASFAKLKLIHDNAKHRDGASRMAATEIEYLLVLCRSVFDLLQEIVAKIWDTVELVDPAKNKRQLKKSFADMALSGDQPRPAQDLTARFGLPEALAACYNRHIPLFIRLRKFRDELVHRGSSVQLIFSMDEGFFIEKRLGAFRDLEIWTDEETKPNDLVPLKPALAMLVHGTLSACDDFAITLQQIIGFPRPTVPGMGLFSRGYFNDEFASAMRDAQQRAGKGHSLTPFQATP